MFFAFHVDKVFDDLEVRADKNRHREIVEARRKDVRHLVCDRLLIAPFKERTKLLRVS